MLHFLLPFSKLTREDLLQVGSQGENAVVHGVVGLD